MDNMANKCFSLCFNNVKHIPFEKYEKDFIFIVNNKQYKTSRIFADLLSPIISQYHYIDETIDSITIKYDNDNTEKGQFNSLTNDYFSDFLKLAEFTPKVIDDNHKKHYVQYFLQLGNIDEVRQLQPEYFDLNPENIIDHLKSSKIVINEDQNNIYNILAE